MYELAVAHFGKQESLDFNDFFPNYFMHSVTVALAGREINCFIKSSVIKRYLTSVLIDFDHTVIDMKFSIKKNHANPMHFGFKSAPRNLSRFNLNCQGCCNVIIIFQSAMLFLKIKVFVTCVD
jgi:hypothetical protein